LGGLFGRCTGALLREVGLVTAVSGVYAVVGASAMLCGFKQMAAAVVLIVVQCVNDFSITPVVMLSVSVALAVNRKMNEKGHDEEQIERKGLPFLEGEVPRSLDGSFAFELMDVLPEQAKLRPHASVHEVEAALEATREESRTDFPVLEGDSCVGIITRAHLKATLESLEAHIAASTPSSLAGPGGSFAGGETRRRLRRSDELVFARVSSGFSLAPLADDHQDRAFLPLDRIMDPTPFTIDEEMPGPRLYALFAKAGETAAIVTSRSGEFRGIITRLGLIKSARLLAKEG